MSVIHRYSVLCTPQRYFYVTLGLGTPRRNFSVIIDTGSTITYVPCKGCKHCGKQKVGSLRALSECLDHVYFVYIHLGSDPHQGEAFDLKSSKTAVPLKCASPLCDCGYPSCQCVDKKCHYSRTYGEASKIVSIYDPCIHDKMKI